MNLSYKVYFLSKKMSYNQLILATTEGYSALINFSTAVGGARKILNARASLFNLFYKLPATT